MTLASIILNDRQYVLAMYYDSKLLKNFNLTHSYHYATEASINNLFAETYVTYRFYAYRGTLYPTTTPLRVTLLLTMNSI